MLSTLLHYSLLAAYFDSTRRGIDNYYSLLLRPRSDEQRIAEWGAAMGGLNGVGESNNNDNGTCGGSSSIPFPAVALDAQKYSEDKDDAPD